MAGTASAATGHILQSALYMILFGLGTIIGGYNMITGPVRLRVRREHAELAREVLAEMGPAGDPGELTPHD